MANTVGQVEYVVKLSTNELKKGVTEAKAEISQLGSSAGKSGSKLSALGTVGKAAGLAVVAGTALAIKATGDLIGETVGAYKEYQQLEGGVKKIFGDTMPTVMANAQKAFEEAQISANDYMSQVTGFSASLLQATGGNAEEAAKIANMAILDMADNANTYGTSMESIQSAYQGFAKQQYSLLDNLRLGYGGTKSEMERLLADATALTGVKYDISNLGDVYNAIHAIQEQANITGTSASEAMTTIEGSANMVKAAFENIKSALGSGDKNFLTTAMDGFVKGIRSLVTNISAILPNIATGLSQIIVAVKEQLPTMIQELFPSLMEGITAVLTAVIEAAPTILEVLMQMTPMIIDSIFQILASIMEVLPEILIVLTQIVIAIAQALVKPENLKMILNAAIQLLLALAEAIPQIIIALVDALPDLIASVVEFLTDPATILMIMKATVQLWMGIVQAVPQILGALFKAFGELFGKLWERLKTLFSEFVGNFGETVKGIFKGAINGVLAFIESFVNSPIDLLNGFIDGINSAFGAIGVNIGHIGRVTLPRLAQGGIVESQRGGQVIVAGEGGEDEWVVPESKMADMIAKLTADQTTAGSVININVDGIWATNEAQKREVAIDIWDKIQEVNKSRMGAMNI